MIALVKPLSLDTPTLDFYLPVAVASTALLCGLIGLRGGINRLDGAALLALYAAYVTAAVLIAL